MNINKYYRFILSALLMTAGVAFAQEYRLMWVSRFEWPNANQNTAKTNINRIMTKLDNYNFNGVVFQVRGQCDVHYPSPNEPWTNNYNWTNPGWDPLAYAITAAHSRGLEFHAYINTHTIAASLPPGLTSPQHIFNLHGDSATGENNWEIHDQNGNPVGKAEDNYVWMSPGHPEASLWTRQQIMYVVNNYNVDGVHFDRIRVPASIYSHDPVSEARFTGEGNPDGVGWADFMRRQFTDDLRRIYGQIAMVKPSVKVSAAPFGIMYVDSTTQYQGTGGQAYHNCYQDGFRWLSEGCLDFIVPQIYWPVGSSHPYEKILADWLSHTTGGRLVVGGSTTSGGNRTTDQMLAEIAETRSQGAGGWCVFSYSSMNNYWDTLVSQPFTSKAAVPAMPWKTSPTKGFITGYVTDADGNPLTDAKIVLANDTLKNAAGTAPYNHLTGADGFYAILNVTPGSSHQLTFSKSGKVPVTKKAVSVTAGSVTQVNCQFSSAIPDPDPPTEVIVEVRDASGNLTPRYTENKSSSGWGFANTTAKSTAPGLSGKGGRYIGTNGLGAQGIFTPNLTGACNYNVYVTLSYGTNNVSPGAGWKIVSNGTTLASGTVDLTYTNTNVVNKWYKLAGPLPLPQGLKTSVTFTNNNTASADTKGRFVMDAVKFEPTFPAKVQDWELY